MLSIVFPRFLCLALLALGILVAPSQAYIDMSADALTLPRLLLEFRSIGVYEVVRSDLEEGKVQFRLVELIQGAKANTDPKHVLKYGENTPAELKKLKTGQRAVIFAEDGYGRSVVFSDGAWYVATYSSATSWSHIAYTAAHYDFNCCFVGSTAELGEALQQLLKGRAAVVNSRKKSQVAPTQFVRYLFREPHRKEVVAAPKRADGSKPKPSETRPALADLVAALKDKESGKRVEAALGLGELGAEAKTAEPALRAVLAEDKDLFARRAAAVALGKIGAGAREAVPTLTAVLLQTPAADIDRVVALEASVALARVDPEGTASVPILTAKLKDPTDYVRLYAASALGGLGPAARAGTPALIEALKKDKWTDVRMAAADALASIRGDPKITVAALEGALADESAYVRTAAARALGKLGPEAKAAIPALQKAMKDKDAETRQAAEESLGKIQVK